MIPRQLHYFAVLLALATLALVGIGGLVTSHGVGLAVPDWPNTYGYNLFFFPISQWVGGVFYEHTHRLAASAVGLLTTIFALWLYGRSARPFLRWTGVLLLLLAVVTLALTPGRWADGLVLGAAGLAGLAASFVWPRNEPAPKWLRRLGLAAFFGVVLQGVLGGLRVVLFKDQIGVFHAALAQGFFVLVCSLAVFTSPRWNQPTRIAEESNSAWPWAAWLPRFYLLGSLLILTQLLVGATMRHQHAGLAIPDFPLAYGRWWPAMDTSALAHYNQQRIEVTDANPITAFQIGLQMVHRVLALIILGAAVVSAWITRRGLGSGHPLSRWVLALVGLILAQALLGSATIWSNKAADIATLHVLVGALSLALSSILSLNAVRVFGHTQPIHKTVADPEPDSAAPLTPHPVPLPGLH